MFAGDRLFSPVEGTMRKVAWCDGAVKERDADRKALMKLSRETLKKLCGNASVAVSGSKDALVERYCSTTQHESPISHGIESLGV